MRAALYARVSNEEQVEGYSIDAQKRAFQALVGGRGWLMIGPCAGSQVVHFSFCSVF